MSKWQPIETAPADLPVLTFSARGGGRVNMAVSVRRSSGVWFWSQEDTNMLLGRSEPTHWMPLPEPPK